MSTPPPNARQPLYPSISSFTAAEPASIPISGMYAVSAVVDNRDGSIATLPSTIQWVGVDPAEFAGGGQGAFVELTSGTSQTINSSLAVSGNNAINFTDSAITTDFTGASVVFGGGTAATTVTTSGTGPGVTFNLQNAASVSVPNTTTSSNAAAAVNVGSLSGLIGTGFVQLTSTTAQTINSSLTVSGSNVANVTLAPTALSIGGTTGSAVTVGGLSTSVDLSAGQYVYVPNTTSASNALAAVNVGSIEGLLPGGSQVVIYEQAPAAYSSGGAQMSFPGTGFPADEYIAIPLFVSLKQGSGPQPYVWVDWGPVSAYQSFAYDPSGANTAGLQITIVGPGASNVTLVTGVLYIRTAATQNLVVIPGNSTTAGFGVALATPPSSFPT